MGGGGGGINRESWSTNCYGREKPRKSTRPYAKYRNGTGFEDGQEKEREERILGPLTKHLERGLEAQGGREKRVGVPLSRSLSVPLQESLSRQNESPLSDQGNSAMAGEIGDEVKDRVGNWTQPTSRQMNSTCIERTREVLTDSSSRAARKLMCTI